MPTVKLLLVEDDRDDIFFLKEALRDNGVSFTMQEIMTGDAVIPHLEESEYLPDAIVLDLNLPRMHGRDVLRELKSREKFKEIPVVILTTSTAKEDMDYCLGLGAATYTVKPVSVDAYDKIVEVIIDNCTKKPESH